ncbi:DUF3566 domain-containing protein [Kribbella deserti]|uniref:DUF3566 domain-containing protein n=1 Tax=Kribbella deserti TaxID=1926257 RepID=A0ABV6QV18_9ACTN
MSNRARPTWPEGQAENASSRPARGTTGQPAAKPQGGAKPAAPGANQGSPGSAPAAPAPSGPGNGQPRPAQTGGGRPAAPSGQNRPAPTPSTPGRPAVTQPVNQSPSPKPAQPASAGPVAAPNRPAAVVTPKDTPAPLSEQKARDEATSRIQEPSKATSAPRTRKAQLRLTRLDPWSVMKTALLLSVAFGIVTWVAVFIVWSAIDAAGVFENLNRTVNEVLGTTSAEPFRIQDYISTGKVMGFTTLLAVADVFIITALATLGSFLYNIAATLLGGLEVTLASED